jgi:hypothetical protein
MVVLRLVCPRRVFNDADIVIYLQQVGNEGVVKSQLMVRLVYVDGHF